MRTSVFDSLYPKSIIRDLLTFKLAFDTNGIHEDASIWLLLCFARKLASGAKNFRITRFLSLVSTTRTGHWSTTSKKSVTSWKRTAQMMVPPKKMPKFYDSYIHQIWHWRTRQGVWETRRSFANPSTVSTFCSGYLLKLIWIDPTKHALVPKVENESSW